MSVTLLIDEFFFVEGHALLLYNRFKGYESKVCLYMLLQIDGHIFK